MFLFINPALHIIDNLALVGAVSLVVVASIAYITRAYCSQFLAVDLDD